MLIESVTTHCSPQTEPSTPEFPGHLHVAECQSGRALCQLPVLDFHQREETEIMRRCKYARYELVNFIHRQTCVIRGSMLRLLCFQIRQDCRQRSASLPAVKYTADINRLPQMKHGCALIISQSTLSVQREVC